MLPQEMGCGSGMTCWRRLKEWHEAGVWEWLHKELLDRLGEACQIDRERASSDSASVAAPGGPKDRPEADGQGQAGLEAPRYCGRPAGSPAHSETQRRQRVHDSKVLEEIVDAISPIRKPGRASARRSCTPMRATISSRAAARP